ncbi:hypothetical protein [Pedobacter terrae]|uniref:hypothetical protein n=1 Tax=Pedobacter terrae TaxID=405671 RepID=UPI002FFD39E4
MKRITDLKSTRKTAFVFRSEKAGNARFQKTDPTTSTVTVITTLTGVQRSTP